MYTRTSYNQIEPVRPSWFRLGLLAVALAVASCGNGVPSEAPIANGATCQTNADCAADSICVDSACVSLSGVIPPDAGSDGDGGSDNGTPDAGNQQSYGNYCQACGSDSDCGTALCLQVGGFPSYCGYPCNVPGTSEGCPSGAQCYSVGGSANCYPMSGTCDTTTTPDAGQQTGHDAGTRGGHDAGTTGHDAGTTSPPDAGVCTTETWANHWDSWFSSTCFSCHQHRGETESWAAGSSAYSYMSACLMPQGGPCVSSSDLAAIKQWENCGDP